MQSPGTGHPRLLVFDLSSCKDLLLTSLNPSPMAHPRPRPFQGPPASHLSGTPSQATHSLLPAHLFPSQPSVIQPPPLSSQVPDPQLLHSQSFLESHRGHPSPHSQPLARFARQSPNPGQASCLMAVFLRPPCWPWLEKRTTVTVALSPQPPSAFLPLDLPPLMTLPVPSPQLCWDVTISCLPLFSLPTPRA